ncbi:MAG: methanogenesis marker 3 protein [Methanomicrobiales archaeon]|nr:methanogenesis marker 3 protein [Methanomicrobiales archaeon]
MEILLDGRRRQVPSGTRLSEILEAHDPCCSIAVVRPAAAQATQTRTILVATTRGEVVIELSASPGITLDIAGLATPLPLHWADRYAAAFGPFPLEFTPSRTPRPYSRGDVLVGCGGYDPRHSYLIFSRIRHLADHGAVGEGGVVGRVVSGGGVIDRWMAGDRIERIERVISWEDRTTAFTTTDPSSLPLEDGMQVVTRVAVVAQGYTPEKVDTSLAATVEHLLLVVQRGHFHVHRAASTHIRDESLSGSDLPTEEKQFRGEGTVTVRSEGPGRGDVYIYRTDLPGTPAHSVAGQVVHGIELVKLAKAGEILCISVSPPRLDLIGMTAEKAVKVAGERGLTTALDTQDLSRLVVDQDPGTTMEALAKRSVTLSTAPEGKVIGIRLDDDRAPASCEIFRQVTGLKVHALGRMPLFFRFEDVLLFRPPLRQGRKILPENTPEGEVPAYALGMTNDSRKGAGAVGIRSSPHREFGPTSEPFEGTNILGVVVDTGKLGALKEKEMIYVREVGP